jgi:hypothetical protein
MYSIFLYTIGILFIVIFVILSYIKFKYRFWAIQPVFHVYDLPYYLFPPGIINEHLPEKNKYCNFVNIDTLFFEKLTDNQIDRFVRFIQTHFLQNGDNEFLPKKVNIAPYFYGHNSPCFLSFYFEDDVLLDTKTQTPVSAPKHKLISVITTRPLHCSIKNASFELYYVDYLCVHTDYRKKGIAPEIIQTHHYHQRIHNKNIVVSLFKREGTLTGIVPLCVYSTYGFDMRKWTTPPTQLPNEVSLVEIGTNTMQHLLDFIDGQAREFDILIQPGFANLTECIKTKNIFVYLLIQNQVTLGAYFFRKTCTYIEPNCEVLSCFCSVTNSSSNIYFVDGYKNAVDQLRRKYPQFQCAVIEGVSHNPCIIVELLKKYETFLISPTAYFFYNFAYPTFYPEKCLIIN